MRDIALKFRKNEKKINFTHKVKISFSLKHAFQFMQAEIFTLLKSPSQLTFFPHAFINALFYANTQYEEVDVFMLSSWMVKKNKAEK